MIIWLILKKQEMDITHWCMVTKLQKWMKLIVEFGVDAISLKWDHFVYSTCITLLSVPVTHFLLSPFRIFFNSAAFFKYGIEYIFFGLCLFRKFKKLCEQSRVDVLEMFSTDELWFKYVSILIQRCSLRENLWNRADQPWIFQFWTALIFSELALFRTD